MLRLIWVFAGRTCLFVGFVMRQLKLFIVHVYYRTSALAISKFCSSFEIYHILINAIMSPKSDVLETRLGQMLDVWCPNAELDIKVWKKCLSERERNKYGTAIYSQKPSKILNRHWLTSLFGFLLLRKCNGERELQNMHWGLLYCWLGWSVVIFMQKNI